MYIFQDKFNKLNNETKVPIDLPSNGVYEKKSEIYDCFTKDNAFYEECNDSTKKRKTYFCLKLQLIFDIFKGGQNNTVCSYKTFQFTDNSFK